MKKETIKNIFVNVEEWKLQLISSIIESFIDEKYIKALLEGKKVEKNIIDQLNIKNMFTLEINGRDKLENIIIELLRKYAFTKPEPGRDLYNYNDMMDLIGYSNKGKEIMELSDYEGNIEDFLEATKNLYISYGYFKLFLGNLEEKEKEILLQETINNSIFKGDIKGELISEQVKNYIDTSISDMWFQSTLKDT